VFEVDQIVAGDHSDGERAVDTDACRKRIAESVDVDPVADCLDIERRDSAGVRLSGELRDERYRSRFFIALPIVSVLDVRIDRSVTVAVVLRITRTRCVLSLHLLRPQTPSH
jgi:hypothetical protein